MVGTRVVAVALVALLVGACAVPSLGGSDPEPVMPGTVEAFITDIAALESSLGRPVLLPQERPPGLEFVFAGQMQDAGSSSYRIGFQQPDAVVVDLCVGPPGPRNECHPPDDVVEIAVLRDDPAADPPVRVVYRFDEERALRMPDAPPPDIEALRAFWSSVPLSSTRPDWLDPDSPRWRQAAAAGPSSR